MSETKYSSIHEAIAKLEALKVSIESISKVLESTSEVEVTMTSLMKELKDQKARFRKLENQIHIGSNEILDSANNVNEEFLFILLFVLCFVVYFYIAKLIQRREQKYHASFLNQPEQENKGFVILR
jgi:hypothetical protein